MEKALFLPVPGKPQVRSRCVCKSRRSGPAEANTLRSSTNQGAETVLSGNGGVGQTHRQNLIQRIWIKAVCIVTVLLVAYVSRLSAVWMTQQS